MKNSVKIILVLVLSITTIFFNFLSVSASSRDDIYEAYSNRHIEYIKSYPDSYVTSITFFNAREVALRDIKSYKISIFLDGVILDSEIESNVARAIGGIEDIKDNSEGILFNLSVFGNINVGALPTVSINYNDIQRAAIVVDTNSILKLSVITKTNEEITLVKSTIN